MEKAKVSIPLEQGNVFRPAYTSLIPLRVTCLNPFGTGQCLSTVIGVHLSRLLMSQSLWNRAMSFDTTFY